MIPDAGSDAGPQPLRRGPLHAFFVAIAVLHLAGLVALFFVFRLDPLPGWGALLLYAPRLPFIAPVLVTGVALSGWWRLLPALAAAIVLGPLMGLHVNGPGREGQIRLVTWNVWYGAGDPEEVRAALRKANPDLVLFQAAAHRVDVVLRQPPFDAYTYVHADQYVLASRWPARLVGLSTLGWRTWARFAVESPLGPLDVFSVHPRSPRALLRGSLRRTLRSEGAEMEAFEDQLRDVDEAVRHGGGMTIAAGDFNMPESAGSMASLFSGTEDAFAEVGNGYGYTFPTNGRMPVPWLRLDRVLIKRGLRATRAEVIGRSGRGSDHAAVFVELSAAR